MPDKNEPPPAEVVPPAPSLIAVPPAAPACGPEAQPSNPFTAGNDDPAVELKRRLEETRLPSDLKEKILAELPPPQERERLFQELREKGGLSSEQFFASLGLPAQQQP